MTSSDQQDRTPASYREQELLGATFERVDLTGATFERVDLTDASFRHVDLTRASFAGIDLSGARIAEADLHDVEINAELRRVWVNGVEIDSFVQAELDRRDPGRELMRPEDPDGFRRAWDHLEERWAATVDWARTFDPDQLHASVDGEWSFVQTLRHLLYATDCWLNRAVLGDPRPFDALDLPFDGMTPHPEVPWDREARPPLEEVLALRADRQATVRRFLADLTEEQLDSTTTPVEGPGWPPADTYPVREVLLTILNEEWEHRRYAQRDLMILDPAKGAPADPPAPQQPPWEPPMAGTGDQHLLASLDRMRATFRWKADGLDADGLDQRIGASSLTLGGLLQHLAGVEATYFTWRAFGEDPGEPWRSADWEGQPDWDFTTASDRSPDQLYAAYDEAVAAARERVARALDHGGLDQRVRAQDGEGRHANLRRLVADLVEEYGRHTGHADLLREAVDGRVGEDPPADWRPPWYSDPSAG